MTIQDKIYIIILIVLSVFAYKITEKYKKSIEWNKKLVEHNQKLFKKLKECDKGYTENYKKLDSTVKSNSNISDRVINYLHQEYKYKKENK